MILRIWHGWTTPENAEAYEKLLRSEIMPGILARKVTGFGGMSLVKRNLVTEMEFITLMRFDSLAAVKAFSGDDFETAVVPPKARAVLKHFDDRSQHYEIVEDLEPLSR